MGGRICHTLAILFSEVKVQKSIIIYHKTKTHEKKALPGGKYTIIF